MQRNVTLIILTLTLAVIAIVFGLPRLNFYMITGRLFPIHIIEHLSSPVAVDGWDEDGLQLADGRHIPLPEFSRLPVRSMALSEATRSGVELGLDGRVYGLVRVHHWCGNDPVRKHIARVDLSHMLTYLQEGEMQTPPPDPHWRVDEPGGWFSDYGWDVSQFVYFQHAAAFYASEQSAGATNR